MTVIVKSPKDGSPIGQTDRHGNLITTCAKSKIRYGAIHGKLIGRSSKQVTLQRQTTKRPGRYRRDYELRIQRPSNGGLYTLEFSDNHSKDDDLLARRGDQITIVFQANPRTDKLEKVLTIHNETTGQETVFARPKGLDHTSINIVGGIIVGIVIFTVLASTGIDLLAFLGIFLGIPAGIYTTKFFNKQSQKFAEAAGPPPEQQKQLEAQQGLLQTKVEISDRIRQLATELEASHHKFESLKSLYQRMSKADPEMYASRIATLKRGGALMKQQNEGLAKLIAGYQKVAEIIDIEYESGNVANDFTLEPDSAIGQRMAELKLTEERYTTLRSQLEANEEVARLS